MKCQKCFKEFEEKDIQLSHDIPKYMGGTDAEGRHNLCIKCHDIYERLVFYNAYMCLPVEQMLRCRNKVKEFSIKYFKKEDDTYTTP